MSSSVLVSGLVSCVERVGSFALVLGRIDEPGGLARRKARLVQAQRADRALDQALLVVAVEDLERLRQPGLAPVLAQQPVRDAVERADRQAARALRMRIRQQLALAARAHLAGRLVGERDREDRPRRRVLDLEKPGDAMGQHAGFAGAGAGEHEVVARRRRHRLALSRIQVVEQMRNIHEWIVMAAPRLRAARRSSCTCQSGSRRACSIRRDIVAVR